MLAAVQRSLLASRKLCTATTAALPVDLRNRIDRMIKSDDVVVFMKGTQQEPMCGFSRNVKLVSCHPEEPTSIKKRALVTSKRVKEVDIKILDFHNVKFHDYDVLSDPELREGLKIYSDWPTIPQVFMKGEFVGGCDIIVQMHKDGEISDFLDSKGIPNKFGEKK